MSARTCANPECDHNRSTPSPGCARREQAFDHRRAAELAAGLTEADRDVRRAIATNDADLLAEAAEDAHDIAGRLLDLIIPPAITGGEHP